MPSRPTIPVYIGASGPKTLRLVGEIADGFYPKAYSDLESFDRVVGTVTLAAEQGGRDSSTLDIVPTLIISVSSDRESAKKLAKGKLVFHIVNDPAFKLSRELVLQIKNAVAVGDVDRAQNLVPDDVADRLTIWGTAEECTSRLKDRIALFGARDVTTFRVQPIGPSPLEAFDSVVDIASRI